MLPGALFFILLSPFAVLSNGYAGQATNNLAFLGTESSSQDDLTDGQWIDTGSEVVDNGNPE